MSSESIIDVLDEQFFKSTVNRVLMESLPENQVPTNFNIKATDSDLGFYVFSDLDLERLDRVRGAYAPQRPNLTLAYLAGTVFTARTDLALAARYGGDFVTSEESSQIIQLRCAALLKRTGINTGELSQFQELVIDDCPTLAEVIDSGDRSFSDFLRLLDRAGRFRDWIGSVHPDRGVARAYLEEVARQDWIQGGAAKSLRYMMGLATGLPGIDALVGAGVAFADSFLLERLLGGWRPNHFVTKRLLPFLQP